MHLIFLLIVCIPCYFSAPTDPSTHQASSSLDHASSSLDLAPESQLVDRPDIPSRISPEDLEKARRYAAERGHADIASKLVDRPDIPSRISPEDLGKALRYADERHADIASILVDRPDIPSPKLKSAVNPVNHGVWEIVKNMAGKLHL
jgi:hypothetical protein